MIVASTVKLTTMADDTVRLTVDIDPQYGDAACSLFRLRGSPVVIARLTQEAATAAQQAETIAGNTDAPASNEKPKGGPLARLAGQFCANPVFKQWVCSVNPSGGYATAEELAQWVRNACGVESRADLDHSGSAAQRFHEYVRKPFAEWCRTHGVAA